MRENKGVFEKPEEEFEKKGNTERGKGGREGGRTSFSLPAKQRDTEGALKRGSRGVRTRLNKRDYNRMKKRGNTAPTCIL